MEFIWNPFAVPGLVALVMALTLSGIVLRAAPGRAQNRRLALALAVEAVSVGAGFGFGYLAADVPTAHFFQFINVALFFWVPTAYLAFIGTLPSPYARPLRGRGAILTLVAASIALDIALVARPSVFIGEFRHAIYAPEDFVPGPGFLAFQLFIIPFLLYSLLVTVSAWRRAPIGSVMRSRAKAYAIAYVTRDALLLLLILIAVGAANSNFGSPVGYAFVALPLVNLLGAALLAFAILRTQLFDIDLKVKLSIQRGTVVATFVIIFFIVEKIAESYLARTFGIIAGSIATGLLLFLAPRLNKMAEQVGNKAAPAVQNTSQYLAFKRLDVYRGAVEETLHLGPLTQKDRAILDRLRVTREIEATDAEALEADVRKALGRAVALPA